MRGSVKSYQGADGKRRWLFVHDERANGARRQKKRRGFATKAAAERALAESLAEEQSGQGYRPAEGTVEGAFNDFIAARPDLSANSRRNVLWAKDRVCEVLGDVPLRELGPADIEQLYAILARRLGPTSVSGAARIFRQVLGRYVKRRQLSPLLYEGVKTPRARPREAVALTDVEIDTILNRVKGTPYRLPVLLAVSTGMREGEVLALKWSDVSAGELLIKAENTKTRTARRVALYPVVAAEVEEARADAERLARFGVGCEYVCPNRRGEKWPAHTFCISWRLWATRNLKDVRHFRFHDLRHTHASQLLVAGVPLPVVAARLGHSSPLVTATVYSHVVPYTDSSALNRAAAAFGAVPGVGAGGDGAKLRLIK